MLPIRDRAGLSAGELSALSSAIGEMSSLEQVVRWVVGLSPPGEIVEVVVQDEYSHDVVVSWTTGAFLVFDTT